MKVIRNNLIKFIRITESQKPDISLCRTTAAKCGSETVRSKNYRMLKSILLFLSVTAASSLLSVSYGQESDLYMPRDIRDAYDRGTRSYDGNPGQHYFQNSADYTITASIDPATRRLTGYEKIVYRNNSPYTLRELGLHLYQNIFIKGGNRGREVDPADLTDGVILNSLMINGKSLDPGDSSAILYESQTNRFYKMFSRPGSENTIEITWTLIFPVMKEERMGGIDSTSFFFAYWYPQVSVFDDISGWDIFDYNNVAEPYNDFGNFDVAISVPGDYAVWATGELQNPESVLGGNCMERYGKAKSSGEVVHIIGKKDLRKNNFTSKGRDPWKFKAADVSDFAFGISDHYLWDGYSKKLNNGKNVFVQSAYLASSVNYRDVAEMTGFVIRELSDTLIGRAFPYPSMTVFNGNDGMEFPMIVNDREENSKSATWFLTSHEVSHTYLPFLVGINQRRYGWMDEGMTTMLGCEIQKKKISQYDMQEMYLQTYPQIAGTQEDVPLIVNSVYLPDMIYQQHEYMRPSMALWTLRDVLGKEMFKKCLHGFVDRWAGKHPTPYDLFFTFNDISGENLDWFWQPWFLGFSYPDLAIMRIDSSGSENKIFLENRGGMPFPSTLEVKYGDGSTSSLPLDARVWAENNTYIITRPRNKKISALVLHTEGYPDTNAENNLYPSPAK